MSGRRRHLSRGLVWETSAVWDLPTIIAITILAALLGIHPAIIAGRVRYAQKNYRLLSQLIGTGDDPQLIRYSGIMR